MNNLFFLYLKKHRCFLLFILLFTLFFRVVSFIFDLSCGHEICSESVISLVNNYYNKNEFLGYFFENFVFIPFNAGLYVILLGLFTVYVTFISFNKKEFFLFYIVLTIAIALTEVICSLIGSVLNKDFEQFFLIFLMSPIIIAIYPFFILLLFIYIATIGIFNFNYIYFLFAIVVIKIIFYHLVKIVFFKSV